MADNSDQLRRDAEDRVTRLRHAATAEHLWLTAVFFTVMKPWIVRTAVRVALEERANQSARSPFVYVMR
ncbi:MAG: hypothetical protein NTY41_19115 [Proteobacteria bacterium]|nr:hypothetical protein [Pseudomonadota bacterium]